MFGFACVHRAGLAFEILVNNAAVMMEVATLQAANVSLDDWKRTMDFNVTGVVRP